MVCKFCNAEIDDNSSFCKVCGKPVDEALPAEEQSALQEGEMYSESLYEEPVQPEAPKKKVWPLALAIAGAVLSLAVLAWVLLTALGVELKLPENDIFRKDNYTVQAEEAVEDGSVVVATMGDAKLTNAELQIYYRIQVQDFVSYYGSYLQSMGFDSTKPLSEQTCAVDETMTWEQYFLNIALETWQNYQSLCLKAAEDGFALDEEWETELAAIPEALEEQAISGGYENADAMIKDRLGPACTMDIYLQYIKINAMGNEYYAQEYKKLIPTDADAEAYFAENEAVFAESGITKESGLVSSVRHILVCPKAEETTEETDATEATEPTEAATTEATEPTEAATTEQEAYTEAQWADCLARAEEILQQWKDGEATEDSFAALATAHTEDTGSAANGGLYEGITPTSNYVPNFLNWSVDMSRQSGDTDIVQSDYGYHIMYFVSGEAHWLSEARTQLLAERTQTFLEQARERFPMKVNYKKIALAELELA